MRRNACRGHVGRVTLNGTRVRIYHDHDALEYPHSLGRFHGRCRRLAASTASATSTVPVGLLSTCAPTVAG